MHQVEDIEDITLTCGRVEIGAIQTPTGSRWVSNNYITRCHRQLELVGVRVAVRASENQLPAEGLGPQDPGWATQQNEKEVLLKTEELWVNMLQSVQSPTQLSYTTLSQHFRIKCERYFFSKEMCSFVIIVDHVSAYICIRIVVSRLHNINTCTR